MLNFTSFQSEISLLPQAGRPLQLVPEFPDVPVLRSTLLRLEVMVQAPCVDLREFSQLILEDLGATVQIFRLAGREYGSSEGRPNRIEDCIADLGLQACMDAVSAQMLPFETRSSEINETWDHSREIAVYARLIAEESPDMNPDEAYLVGLLHSIGVLPKVLGWESKKSKPVDPELAAFRLANNWSMPSCVIEFFCELQNPGRIMRWTNLIQTAHELANRSSIGCPLEHTFRPQLHKRA